jgi:hypothetical protein
VKQSYPSELRITQVELSIDSALSPSVNLGTAQQERSVLLVDDKWLPREGNEVDLLSNKTGNYEHLKLILIKLKCMRISPRPPKRCT